MSPSEAREENEGIGGGGGHKAGGDGGGGLLMFRQTLLAVGVGESVAEGNSVR